MEDIHIINLFLERSEDAIRQVEVKYEKFCFKIAWNILYNTEDSEECVNAVSYTHLTLPTILRV